ncbi:hypothetical protein GCM10027449_18460 [Sinomonas notoginsengisoli]|uniref:hypothetical protein n=1 Tax=Sinomonas notoginsengisoli TaxID=1457311 RepID=UPI001F3DBE1B|nr:hypothetical protein [Sinomonas notoginsengisoli]
MTWTRLSDDFVDRPKVLGLSDAAFRTHVEALVWCNRQLTDGVLPADPALLGRILSHPEAIPELVAAGLWVHAEGTYILDWVDQEQAADVMERRRKQRERQQRFRQRKA